MDYSNLLLTAENIVRTCANNYTRVSCTVLESRDRFGIVCNIVGPSATLDSARLIEKVSGKEYQNGRMAATVDGQHFDLFVRINYHE